MDLVIAVFITLIGMGMVIGGALLIRRFLSSGSKLRPIHLVISNSVIVLGFMALAATGLFYPAEPFDDVYPLYFLVPGIHIYLVGEQISLAYWAHALESTKFPPHATSIMCIVVIPGVTGLILGGLQWYLLGYLFQQFRKYLQLGKPDVGVQPSA